LRFLHLVLHAFRDLDHLEILFENGVDHGLDDLYYGDQLQGFETVPLLEEL